MRSAFARTPVGVAAAALVLASAVSLAGCEREAVPAAAPPPPPPADQPLAGAPEESPAPPVMAQEEPAPLTPSDQPPPPPVMEAPSAAEPGIVAMAPIPNPPETPRRTYRAAPAHRASRPYGYTRRVHRVYAAGATYSYAATPARVRPIRHAAAPAMRHAAASPYTAAATHPALTSVTGAATASARHAAAATAHRHGGKATPAAASAAPRADRLASLQTTLGGAMASSAKLDTPHFVAGTPADVSLTVPASFAETLRTEAGRQGLADDAASVALIARLAGDGYVVIPDTVQRQMLAAGQPSVFHWTVTQQQGARGPLQAGIGAQLMGGGGQDQLDLGVVKVAQASGMGWKVVGAILLLVVLAAIVALIARAGGGSNAPERRRRYPNEMRPAPRPFDMSDAPPLERRDEPPRV